MNTLSLPLAICNKGIQMFSVGNVLLCVASLDVKFAFCCCCYDYLHHNSYYVWHWNTFWLRRPVMKLQKQQQQQQQRQSKEKPGKAECNNKNNKQDKRAPTGFIIFGSIIICLGTCKWSKKLFQFHFCCKNNLKWGWRRKMNRHWVELKVTNSIWTWDLFRIKNIDMCIAIFCLLLNTFIFLSLYFYSSDCFSIKHLKTEPSCNT